MWQNAAAPGPGWPTSRSVVYARRAAVATSQPLAADRGMAVLQSGGNAADAAVAMAAVLAVTEPMSTGLGGDVACLVSRPGEPVMNLNASGWLGRRGTYAGLAAGAVDGAMPTRGPLCVTVPGAVKGLASLAARYGTRPFEELISPAADLAEHGYPVAPLTSGAWRAKERELRERPGAAALYLPGGHAPRPGEIVTAPELARTLRRLADEGAEDFYRGAIAEALVSWSLESGGFVDREDLAEFDVVWQPAPSVGFDGLEVYECAPNSHGVATLLALRLLGPERFSDSRDPVYWHHAIEAMKLAAGRCADEIADPSAMRVDVAGLLDVDPLDLARTGSGGSALAPDADYLTKGDTVYLTAVDESGLCVSLMNSLYQDFGSMEVVGDTGICLHNRGACFTLREGHVNAPAPRKRPYHTLMPGMARFTDGSVLSFGVMGGYMQPQGQLQVLMNFWRFGMDIQQAIDAPRFRWTGGDDVVLEDALYDAVGDALAARGHRVSRGEPDPFARSMGGGQGVHHDAQREVLSAGSDPRKDGQARGW